MDLRVGDTVVRKINHQSRFWRSQVGPDMGRPFVVRMVFDNIISLEGLSEDFIYDRFLKIV